MENKDTGRKIRAARDSKAWTQEHLAEAAGLSVRTVQRAEEGVMSAETLSAAAGALGISVEDLTVAAPPSVTPVIYYDDPATLDFLVAAFGFEIEMRYVSPDNRIQHAELTTGTGRIMIGQPIAERAWTTPKQSGVRTQSTYVMVDDVEAHHARARAAGATVLSAPDDVHGERRYLAEDPEGHHWWFASPST